MQYVPLNILQTHKNENIIFKKRPNYKLKMNYKTSFPHKVNNERSNLSS